MSTTTDTEVVLSHLAALRAAGAGEDRLQRTRRTLLDLAGLCPDGLLAAQTEHIIRWGDIRGFADKPRERRMGVLRGFYDWCVAERLLVVSPIVDGMAPARARRVNRAPLDDETAHLVAGFRDAQQRRNLSPLTIERRRCDIVRLAEFTPGSLLDVSRAEIIRYLATRGQAPRTQYATVSNLHAFYVWARREGLTDEDPTVDVDRPRLPRLIPRPIADDDLALALEHAEPAMRLWLALASRAGLRCAEIGQLEREDILDHADPPTLNVGRGKGGHQRVVPLHPLVIAELRRFNGPRTGPLFFNSVRRQLNGNDISIQTNRYLRDLGIDSTMHKLRHWFGTEVYRASQDLRLTQELLGHSSPTTTAGYAAWSNARAAETIRDLR